MKQLCSTYSISGSSVTLTGVNVPLSQILLVSDATTGNVLYSMAGPAATGYTQGANSTIVLATAPSSSDKLTIYYDDGAAVTNGPTSVSVSGSVSVSNFPATQPVSGMVAVSNQPTSISVSNFPATQPVSGTVAVSGTIPVSAASALPVSGSVSVSNFPATQPVSGTVTAARNWNLAASSDSLTAAVSSLPAVSLASGQTLTAAVSSLPAVSGNVGITSLPSVTVSNPTTGTPTLGAAVSLASGQNVGISSLPAVSGSVSLAGGQTLTAALANGSTLSASGGDLTSGSQKTQIVSGSNTLSVDSLGAVTVNNGVLSAAYNYTATGVVSSGTILVGPIDCAQFREVSLQCTAIGTAASIVLQVSNDGTNWVNSNYVTPNGSITTSISTVAFVNYPLNNAKFFRVIQNTSQTALTTTFVAYASQQATPKLYQSVAVTGGTLGISSLPANSEIRIASSFSRPANTTAYASGKLVANSITAGSVVPLTFASAVRVVGDCVRIERVRISKTGTSLTNASFRIHLFESLPTVTVGDGTAFNASGVLSCNAVLNYVGSFITSMGYAGSDGALGVALPDYGSGVTASPTSGTSLYGLIEVLAAYTPVSAETFTVALEGYRV